MTTPPTSAPGPSAPAPPRWTTSTRRSLARVAAGRAADLRRLLRGGARAPTPLGNMTLEADDAALAREWLRRRAEWDDEAPVEAYEAGFARWNGSRHASAFASGREALSACVEALDIGPGDEVIVPGYTCVVVPNAFLFVGATPVYADVELDTFGLDAASVEARVTPRTKAILLHHLYGLVSRDHEAVIGLARRRGLRVIEDCAHATGARHKGRRVGNLGDVAFVSSEQSKVFNTIQGGVAFTNDDALGRRLAAIRRRQPRTDGATTGRLLRNVLLNHATHRHPRRWLVRDVAELRHGPLRLVSTTEGEMAHQRPPGYGRRLAAPLAALGANQLRKLDRLNDERRRAAARWGAWCDEKGYRRPLVLEGSEPVFVRYPVLVEPERKRDVSWGPRELGAQVGVWFRTHLHPAPDAVAGCPNADEAVARCVNLPTLGVEHGERA